MTITVSTVSNTQTFGTWLATTNRLAEIASQNTVTADSTTGGSVTTGNSFVNGHFGAQFVYVANTLAGGNVSSNGVLRIQANLAVFDSTSNLLVVTANSTQTSVRAVANVITMLATSNTTVSGGAFIVNTANITFSGANIDFSTSAIVSNLTFANSVIIANGSFGTNGTVLFSNGTQMYWGSLPTVVGNSGIVANADGIFVNANNGLSANSTGVFVVQGTGTVVNSTGVHVNSAYIGTIGANSATGSLTNTFTIGTASYFVANGNLGVGNSAPAHKLRVDGDISLSGGIHANGSLGSANQALFSNGSSAYWANVVGGAVITANNTDSQTFYLPMSNTISGAWSNGVVSNTKLYFVPSTGTLNATIFNSLSDISRKTDVVTIDSGLDKVLAMRGVEFRWVDTKERSSGVIAQELESVLSHLVKENQDGIKSVNYDGIIPYLIEAIHELTERVSRLEDV